MGSPLTLAEPHFTPVRVSTSPFTAVSGLRQMIRAKKDRNAATLRGGKENVLKSAVY